MTTNNNTYHNYDRDIQIDIKTSFIPERSSEEDNQYFFKYEINFTNHGSEFRVLERKWKIRDGNGKKYEVQGVGIQGERPIVSDCFDYQSFVPLHSPSGNMRGEFLVERDGDKFWIDTPLIWFRVQ